MITKKQIKAIEQYQCAGCVVGGDLECYEHTDNYGIQCSAHVCGTMIMPTVGMLLLGMPTGFCRLGEGKQKVQIFKNYEHLNEGWNYGIYNVPVWKHRTEEGHILVRGLSPRINKTFLHVIIEDCFDSIDCIEIADDDIKKMD